MALQVCRANYNLFCLMDGALPKVLAPDRVGTTDQDRPSKPAQTVCTNKITIFVYLIYYVKG